MGLFSNLFKSNDSNDIDLLQDEYGDEPEGPWAECTDCDTVMDYSFSLRRFRCPICGKEIDEDDYEPEDDWYCETVCQCDAYPACKTSCKMFDD